MMARRFAVSSWGVSRKSAWMILLVSAGILSFSLQAPTYAQNTTQPEIKKVEVKTETKIEWAKLSTDQQLALAPVQREWVTMSGSQQKRLVSAAKDYSKLQPIQKERFQTRLRDWAALTPEQRKAARTKYETLSKLPPAKQFEIHEKWQDKQAAKSAPNATAAPETAFGAAGVKVVPITPTQPPTGAQ